MTLEQAWLTTVNLKDRQHATADGWACKPISGVRCKQQAGRLSLTGEREETAMPGREPLRDPMAWLRKKSEFCMGNGHYLCQSKYCTCDCHERRADPFSRWPRSKFPP